MSRLLKDISKDRKIYGNWEVYSPGDILMFRCDLKRATWYLSRNLAEKISDNSIKLTFEPKGLGKSETEWGVSKIENKCVNCGTDEYLTRHHVVPISYRKYFPSHKKDRNHHDVLSLCRDCHENYEIKAHKLKEEVSYKYDVPLNGFTMSDFDKDFIKIKKVASVLCRDTSRIPKKRLSELKSQLKSYFNWKNITKKRINSVNDIDIKYHVKTHGELVVSKLEDIDDFIRMWRKHFIDNNDCLYLPKGWSVYND